MKGCSLDVVINLSNIENGRYDFSIYNMESLDFNGSITLRDDQNASHYVVNEGEFLAIDIEESDLSNTNKKFTLNIRNDLKPQYSVRGDTLFSDHRWGNVWYLDGQEVSRESSIVSDQPGLYNLVVEQYGCIAYSDTLHKKITGVSSKDDSKYKYRISPNPFEDYIQIDFLDNSAGRYYLSIIDINGNVLFQKNVNVSGNETSLTWQFEKRLAKGIFFCKIYGEGNDSGFFKLIKQ